MKHEIKTISSVRKEITTVIPKEDLENENNLLLQSFAKNVKVSGFRPGKVPAAVIKSRFAKELSNQLDNQLASKAFDDVVKSENLNVFSLVKLGTEINEDGDKKIHFLVDLKPDFELFDYKNISIDEPEISISEDEIAQGIEQIQNHYADFVEVKREVKAGDFVRLEYTGTFEDGTKVSDKLKSAPIFAEQKNTWEEAAASDDIPGIKAVVDGIVGMKIDEEKDVKMAFPSDFKINELQGKNVKYHVKIFEIREKILPVLDEEFFKKLKVNSLEELKSQVKNDLTQRKVQSIRFEQRENVVQKMIKAATFDLPESAINYEQIYILRSFEERQMHQGMTQEMREANRQKLIEDTKDLSIDRAKVNFTLEKIAEKEKISVSDKEMGQMIVQEASMLRTSPDQLVSELKNDRDRIQELQRRALFGKTLDFVLVSNLKSNQPASEDSSKNKEKSAVNVD